MPFCLKSCQNYNLFRMLNRKLNLKLIGIEFDIKTCIFLYIYITIKHKSYVRAFD